MRLALLVLSTLAAVSQPEATYAAPVGVRGWMNGSIRLLGLKPHVVMMASAAQTSGLQPVRSVWTPVTTGYLKMRLDFIYPLLPAGSGRRRLQLRHAAPGRNLLFLRERLHEEFPFRCVKDSPPERPAQCYSNGGKINDTTDNPVIIATGSKSPIRKPIRLGRRSVRHLPQLSQHSDRKLDQRQLSPRRSDHRLAVQFRHGAAAWSFSGGVSGTPTGRVTLLAPDGSSATTQSANDGTVHAARVQRRSFDYKVEFIGTLPTNLANVKTSSTQWRITGPDDRVWTLRTIAPPRFPAASTSSQGRRRSLPAMAISWTFNYASDKSLTSIVDTFGRTATFTWNCFYRSWVSGVAPGASGRHDYLS